MLENWAVSLSVDNTGRNGGAKQTKPAQERLHSLLGVEEGERVCGSSAVRR